MTQLAVKRVAIIGGSGFIGQSLAQELVTAGYAVTVLDLMQPKELEYCKYWSFDIGAPQGFPFDQELFYAVVIAAGIMAKGCNEDPDYAWQVNVTATRRFLEHISRVSPASRIVFLSSGMVYDSKKSSPPFTESAPTLGRCTYTKSKLEIEATLAKGLGSRPPADLILRPFTVYGKDALSAERGHLFGRWLKLGQKRQALTVYGDGSQVIDPVPVEYISEACIAWLEQATVEGVTTINITSGGPLALRGLAEMFVETGLAPGIECLPAVAGDASRGWGDARAYENLVGRAISESPKSLISGFLLSLIDDSVIK